MRNRVHVPMWLTMVALFLFSFAPSFTRDAAAQLNSPNDLVITSGSPVITPGSVPAGGTFKISPFTVKNQGPGSPMGLPSAFLNGFYLSTDTAITSTDLYLGGNSNPGLAGGSFTAWTTTTLTIPIGTLPGLYYVGILVDRTNVVAESNEFNNTVYNRIVVVAPSKIDLMIPSGTPVLTPSSVPAGGSFTLSAWTAKNQGGTAAGAFSSGFYLSTDAVITPSDTFLGGNTNPGLASMASTAYGASMLTIPVGTVPGIYYIGILVDRTGAVAESDETNNYVSQKIDISAARPDLMIPSGPPVTTPTSVPAGGSFTLSAWTVKNQGPAAAGAFSNGFYLSTDTVITPSDVYLTGNSNPGLAALASFAWGAPTLTIPAGTVPGSYYIGILVDRTGAVAESNETNNYVFTKINVTASLPDLMIPSGTPVLTPSSVPAGGSFTLSAWTAKNQGGSAAGAFSSGFYLSTDAVITPSDTFLGGNTNPGLASLASTAYGAMALTIPAGTVPGSYYIGILVDRTGAVAEFNETNNYVFTKINVTASLPDLLISSGAPTLTPTSVIPGGSVALTPWTVKNQGGTAAGSFSNGFYLSTDAVITPSDVYLGGNSNTGLASLASFGWAGSTVTVPLGTAPGTYYIGILADRTGAVAESNESNNYACNKIAVLDPRPDLTIPSGTPTLTPNIVIPGGSFTVSPWKVMNAGPVAAGAFYNGFYLSNDTVITASDVYLGGNSNSGLAALSTFAWGSPTLSIPIGTVPGTYYVGILTDRTGAVSETNETNNYVFGKITVVASLPDLTITSGAPVFTPAVVAPGGSFTVSPWTVKNAGPIAAGGFQNHFYLSTDALITPSDVYLWGGGITGLGSGVALTWPGVSLTIPASTPPGVYYVGLIVDPLSQVAESNEANNKVMATIKVGDDHGNTPATASAASVNVPIGGVIEVPADVDFFAVTLTAGLTYDIHVNTVALWDSMLWIYKSDGVTQLGYNDDDPLGGLDSRITYTATTTGVYYIKVASYFGYYTGSYTLTVTH